MDQADRVVQAIPRRQTSIVLGTLEDPGPNVLLQTRRQRLVPIRHLQFCLTLDQHDQIAAVGLTRKHHRPEFRTFHQSVIAGQIKPAGIIALAAGLMAGNTPTLEDRRDILSVTHLRLLRARLSEWWRKGCPGYRQHTDGNAGKNKF